MKVMCIMSDGFEELEAVGTIALLRRAGITIDIYAIDNTLASGRFEINMHNLNNLNAAKASQYDALFLPGGPHHQLLRNNEMVKNIIHNFYEQDKIIGAICAAPTILGEMGLLKHKKYTCFTSMDKDFGGTYIDEYTVTDGNLVTGRSAAASIVFAFAFMEKISDKATVEKVKKEIYY